MTTNLNTATFKVAALTLFLVTLTAYGQAKIETTKQSADIWINSAKGGSTTVEFVSDGKVSGLQFEITLPESVMKNVSLNCGGSLPSTHTAICKQHENFLRVVVFSMESAILPDATIIQFATTAQESFYSKNNQTKANKASLMNVILADDSGQEITPEYL